MNYDDSIKIKRIFNRISYRYDFLNNLLSFGLHNLWKRRLIRLLEPLNGESWADLCCGTGDMALLIIKRVIPNGKIVGIDNANDILEIAKIKSKEFDQKNISWKKMDIFDLDPKKSKYDGICMSYGLRNLINVEEGLYKVFSLLNENGRAGFLDFNHAPEKSLQSIFQKLYLRFVVVPISKIFSLKEEYNYIEKSIKSFPFKSQLIYMAKKIGYKDIIYKKICGGQMFMLVLKK